ncbi:hypothetical protein BHM03_00007727 [Ensete ventricosum]|uniref:Uncharacterized protein n=1 Tax=Ensete ventricosum TaxID=4639 RepID=A0A445MC82_ENSVE|nr:hypothetical protein BHM03_00007727 [Ensete ventricosum]
MARRRGEKKREDEREKFGSPVRCSSSAPPLDLLCAGVRSPARGDERRGRRRRWRRRGRNLVPPCAALPRFPRAICRSRAIPSPRAGRRFFSPHVSPRGEKERGDKRPLDGGKQGIPVKMVKKDKLVSMVGKNVRSETSAVSVAPRCIDRYARAY